MLSDLLSQPALLIALQVVLLTVPGIVLAWLFRMIGLPGGKGAAALCGGILAGILMGSLVLGGASPQVYDPVITGAVEERAELDQAEADRDGELAAALAALRQTGVSDVAAEELQAEIEQRYEPRITAARESLADAEREHRRNLSILLATLAGLVFASGYFRRTRSEITERPPGTPEAPVERAVPKVIAPFPPAPVELLMLVMAAAPGAILARWLLEASVPVAIAFGLVLAVPGSTVRRGAQAMSGGWAFLIAALVVSLCATAAFASTGASTVLIGTAMVFSLALLLIDNTLLKTRRAEIRFHDTLFYALLLPALAGAMTTIVDLAALVDTGAFWIALLIGLIISGDGRWFGYGLAIRFFADPPLPGRAWVLANSAISAGAPVLQLVLAVLAFRAEPMAGSLVFAAVAGSAMLELSRPLRARIAHRFGDILAPGATDTK